MTGHGFDDQGKSLPSPAAKSSASFDSRVGLRVRLGLTVGGLACGLALAIGFLFAELARNHLAERQGQALSGLAAQILDALDRGMFERFREIQILAELDEFRSPATPVDSKRRILERVQSTYQYYAWIGIADLASGQGLVGTQGYLETRDLSKRPWFSEGAKSPYVGDVHDALLLAKLLPNPRGAPIYLLDVATPIRDPDGNVVQVLCGHLHWWWTQDVVNTFNKPADTQIFLISREGIVLIGTTGNEGEAFSRIAPAGMDLTSVNRGGDLLRWQDGTIYLSGSARSQGYQSYPGLGWTIIVRQNESTALALARATRERILWIGGIAGLLGAIVGWQLAGRLAAPIERLSAAAARIGEGALTEPIPLVSGYREVATLARSLSGMVNSLTTEIAERRAAEAQLKLAATVFRSSSEGILITDAANTVVAVNDSFSAITEYRREEILGQHPSILGSGRHGPDFYISMWQTLAATGGWQGEIWNRRKNGEIYPEWLSIKAVSDEDGRLANYVAVFRDITEIRKADEAIRKLQRAVEQSPVAIIITDTAANIEYVNPQFTLNTGYSFEDVVGRNPRILRDGGKPDAEYKALWETISSGRTWTGEFCNRRKDGSTYWEEAIIAPIRNAEGAITHYVAIKEDVTARKKAERELMQTLDLVTRQNSELERFAYVAAHDLQEPLRTITAFTQLIERQMSERLTVEEKDWMGLVSSAALRMYSLINDLLIYSRIAADTPLKIIDMGVCCREALDNVRQSLEATGGTVTVEPLPKVHGDHRQMVQLWQNLLGNSIKFHNPLRPLAIRIQAREDGGVWEFSVTDNGIGIEDSEHDMFDLFRRQHTAEKYPGTGIGLTICKRIVMHHGGRIWFQARPNEGCTFFFTIPSSVAVELEGAGGFPETS